MSHLMMIRYIRRLIIFLHLEYCTRKETEYNLEIFFGVCAFWNAEMFRRGVLWLYVLDVQVVYHVFALNYTLYLMSIYGRIHSSYERIL